MYNGIYIYIFIIVSLEVVTGLMVIRNFIHQIERERERERQRERERETRVIYKVLLYYKKSKLSSNAVRTIILILILTRIQTYTRVCARKVPANNNYDNK